MKQFDCGRATVAVPRDLPLDGLDYHALVAEGAYQLEIRRLKMDWMKMIFGGGWIPEGKRTQALGMAAVFGTLVMSVVQWGSGEMDLAALVKSVAENWEGFFAGFLAVFIGDKVDAMKE